MISDLRRERPRVEAITTADAELSAMLSSAARTAARLARVQIGAVVVADAARRLTIQASVGLPATVQAEWYAQPGHGLVGTMVHRGEPLIAGDLRVSAGESHPLGPRVPVRALIILPLKSTDQIFGCLIVADPVVRHFLPEEIDGITHLAAQVSTAIERARQRQVQEQMSQAERLRTIGQLASGVAHEFNNLLATILGRTELLLLRGGLASEVVQPLQVIERAALEGVSTVRLLQNFSRPVAPRRQVLVDLVKLLHEVKEFTRSRWEKEAQVAGIAYEVRIDTEPLPLIFGEPEGLREAFTNLLLNALDAMPRGGQVRFIAARDGDRIRIAIQDTGEGMSAEVRRRGFEPFFTTKGLRGSGLGLSVVWGIVQRHGGEITADSQPGQGTRFTLELPIGTAAKAPESRPPRPKSPRAARILLIDDDPVVRRVLREMLELGGHTIVDVANGPAGLALSETEHFDLVLTDLVMPGMSGWEVAKALKRHESRRPVGLVTGWPSQLDPAEVKTKPVDFVLSKPFRLEDVRRCLAEHLP